MPIYAYRCSACGAEKDVLQKFSDAPLVVCPNCGAETFGRILTAPAFQLKGSGWYVTDFRDGNKGKAGDAPDAAGSSGRKTGGADASARETVAGETKAGETKAGDTKAAATAAVPKATPGGSGSGTA